ncbi:MAG: SRPBCC family protein [Sphaerobacteraceae bacterium]|nr:MAG: SRPBCC family protein [Sphaerobacteraceae bacterium]
MASLSSLPSIDDIASLEDIKDSLNEVDTQGWAPVIGGGALVALGLSRRSLSGLLLASAGGLLLYRGLTPRPSVMRTGASITVNRSPEELYTFWRDLENLPTVMHNLVSVKEIDKTRSHWTAKTFGGATIEWDAEIADEEPNHYIAWKSEHDAPIRTYGVVKFEPAPGNRGTEVNLILKYSMPLGILGAADAAAMGVDPSQQARQDLQRFKQYMETGEIATTSGQPAGERGLMPDVETAAGVINNVAESLNILRTGGRRTKGRAGTRA